jgi:predicted metalloprotease
VASIAAVVLLVGCGSSSDQAAKDTATPTPTPTAQAPSLDRLPEVPAATEATQRPAPGDQFLRNVFDDVQAMWQRDFEAAGIEYIPATMTLFRDEVHTACGTQPASVGPFYCPADHGVYLDTRFFAALSRQAGVALGDFAQAFVVAHEVAHHVQVLLGITQRVRAADEQDPEGTNGRSVRLELQADCLAGVWKHSAYQRGEVTPADLADALNAAAVVGSDFQQARATGIIRPEDWTHGSSRQRQHWLTTGFEHGDPGACDTFGP